MSLNDKIEKFNKSISWFSSEDFSLDQALENYKASSKLAHEIEQDLDELKNEVELLEDFTKS